MSTKTKTAQIVYIEYHDGRPHSVVTEYTCDKYDGTIYQRHEFFDINWSKRDKTLYWHESGSGPASPMTTYDTSIFWAADHITFQEWNTATTGYDLVTMPKGKRLKRAKGKKKLEKALNVAGAEWPDYVNGIEESETIYCSACGDDLPSENTNSPCGHVWWCNDRGDWSMPGERCPWDCQECLKDDREVGPKPPWATIAEGYGMAASHFGSLVRSIMGERGWTAASLVRDYWRYCDDAMAMIMAAMRGETDRFREYEVVEAAIQVGLSEDEQCELVNAFREQEKGRRGDDRRLQSPTAPVPDVHLSPDQFIGHREA